MRKGFFTQDEYDRMNEEILSLGVTVATYYHQNIDKLGCIKLKTFVNYISRSRQKIFSLQHSTPAISVVELTKADLAAVKANPIANKNLKGEAAVVNISYGQVTFEVISDNAPKLIADTILSLHNSATAK